MSQWTRPPLAVSCGASCGIAWTTACKNILAAGVTSDTLVPLSPVCPDKSGSFKTCTFNEPSDFRHSESNSVPFGEVVENFNAF